MGDAPIECASLGSSRIVTIRVFSHPVDFRHLQEPPPRTPMDLQATIGLGLLTLVLGTIAVMGTVPENRVPYAFHITFVTSVAYVVARLV